MWKLSGFPRNKKVQKMFMQVLTQAEGHNVDNHTYHHPDMSKISTKESFQKKLSDLEALYQQTTGQPMKKLIGRIHPGAIVLLHSTSKTNGEILDELLTRWEEMGYRFAPLDDLVQPASAS